MKFDDDLQLITGVDGGAVTRQVRIHRFASTGDAYDACQCDGDIHDGDVIVVESERVVGVADTWPFAVTVDIGHLHVVNDGVVTMEKPALDRGRADAISVARSLGFEVRS